MRGVASGPGHQPQLHPVCKLKQGEGKSPHPLRCVRQGRAASPASSKAGKSRTPCAEQGRDGLQSLRCSPALAWPWQGPALTLLYQLGGAFGDFVKLPAFSFKKKGFSASSADCWLCHQLQLVLLSGILSCLEVSGGNVHVSKH